MFNRSIQTTISILGFVVYIRYFMTAQNAVEWQLDLTWYADHVDPDCAGLGIELLEAVLRVHWSGFIAQRLQEEFEARMYEQETKLSAQADMHTPYDY